jgi:5'-3' exonuclease
MNQQQNLGYNESGVQMSKQSRHGMKIHLVDGTYELFRNYFGAPKRKSPDGREVGATVGFLRSMIALLGQPGTTHVACAFDHVIESFRNKLYPGYKTGEGIDPELLTQFPLAEKAASALGLVVWPMSEFEADDALATAAARFKNAKDVKQVVICSPDKDLAQSVRGKKVVCWDRRREIVYDEKGVVQKFGVHPESMPDWLALVGDAADGYPGIKGWGEKSATAVLSRYKHLESIPQDHKKWKLTVSRAQSLSENLEGHRDDALLFRRLATLREDVPLKEKIGDLEWRGAHKRLKQLCHDLGVEELPKRISTWRSS